MDLPRKPDHQCCNINPLAKIKFAKTPDMQQTSFKQGVTDMFKGKKELKECHKWKLDHLWYFSIKNYVQIVKGSINVPEPDGWMGDIDVIFTNKTKLHCDTSRYGMIEEAKVEITDYCKLEPQ